MSKIKMYPVNLVIMQILIQTKKENKMKTKHQQTNKSVKTLNPCPAHGCAQSRRERNPRFRLLSLFTFNFSLFTVLIAQPESLTISPTSLNFGEVRLGESADLMVEFGNTGEAVIDVTDIIADNDQLSVFPVPFSVYPGGNVPVTVTYTPTEEGAFTDTLTIFSTDPGDPDFELSVTATAIAEPIINISTDSLQFDVVVFEDTLATQTLTIENTGYDTLFVEINQLNQSAVDYDGNSYETVQIGDQLWMAENLKTTHYNNGDEIPNITNNGDWVSLSTGAYCDYDNNPTNSDTYGRLYNWYAVDDARGICPEGWHVPTDEEFTVLTDYLDGTSVAGGKMKEAGTEHWNSPNTGATNESGFTGLPAGYRHVNSGYYYSMGYLGYFWSSSESSSSNAWYRKLHYNSSNVYRNSDYERHGISVRCAGD